jgi:hypothetical protein
MAVVGCAVLVALIAASDPSAAQSRTHRVLKGIWGPTELTSGSAFPTYRSLGVDLYQTALLWSTTAPSRPRGDPRNPNNPDYHWPGTVDQAVAQAARYGIRVAITVEYSPAWANGGHQPNWAPRRDSDFANFVTAAARHYRTVRYWQIWGEPTRSHNFNPLPHHSPTGPRRYARLLDAAYGSLKRVRSSNVVIGGNTFTVGDVSAPDWIRWLRLPNGKPPRLDVFGHNPFSFRFPNLSKRPYYPGVRDFSDVDTLESEITRAYGRQVGLWLSEFTVQSDHTSTAFDFFVSRQDQARWLTAAYNIARHYAPIKMMGWFDLMDHPGGADALTTGLLDQQGNPKPAFFAYRGVPR